MVIARFGKLKDGTQLRIQHSFAAPIVAVLPFKYPPLEV